MAERCGGGKGDSDVQVPGREGELDVLCAGIGQTLIWGRASVHSTGHHALVIYGMFWDAARGEIGGVDTRPTGGVER